MSNQPHPKRTVAKIPDGAQRTSCSYRRVKPFRPCLEEALYVLHVATAGTKRKSYTLHLRYCEEHVPQLSVSPEPAPIPADAIGAQEAADLIGIPIMTLHKWRPRGKGPKSTKTHGRCWYSLRDVTQFAEAYRIVTGS